MKRIRHIQIALSISLFLYPVDPVFAAEWHVAIGGSGNGSAGAPFGRIQDALRVAKPGDAISIGPGTFNERLTSVQGGTAAQPIRLHAAKGRGTTLVTSAGRVLTVSHPYVIVDGLVLDGRFGDDDIVRVGSSATGFTLRNAEVRRTSRDAIDLGAVADVLVENSLIHSALNATGGRTDAHGIVGGAVRRLTIRNTEIHTFSGDAVQVDSGRDAPGWTDVLIDGCRLWLQPLAAATNGFAAGVVPGENAVDTKASAAYSRARITIRNTEARGFRNGLIGNMAAFNLKEHIDAVLDGTTVFDSEIAYRLRAPALVRVQNSVVHTVAVGIRYEENIQNVRVWNTTFGGRVSAAFRAADSGGSTLDVRNFLMLGSALPAEAKGASNLAAPAATFVNAAAHNYQLASGSPAIDAGAAIREVTVDRQGTKRPQGKAYDVGAYERVSSRTAVPSDDGEIVLYASKAPVVSGNWQAVTDDSAANDMRLESTNEGVLVKTPLAKPMDYFELTFTAEAGRPYRLWIRGKAFRNRTGNDSVFVQFTGSVDAQGRAAIRIGSTAAAEIALQDCSGCGLSGWGWQDNSEGDARGPLIYFATTGTHRIRVQNREDGLSIDQIVLSPSAYLTSAPGAQKEDATILPESIF
jgi:hypothetical protein